MTRSAVASIVAVFMVMAFAAPSFSFEGPLMIRNQFPLYGVLDPPVIEKAAVDNYFSAALSHASTYMVRNSPAWSVGLDLEATELDLRYRRSFCDSLEVGLELPVITFGSGFMDGFLSAYHRAFGFADYGRSARPDNEFLYYLDRNGTALARGRTGTGIGDLRVSVKKTVLTGDPAVSLSVNAELPTGSASRGFGNGSLDGGGAVLIDKKLAESVMLYGNAGLVLPGRLRLADALKLNPSPYAGLALEAMLGKSFSVLGQFVIQRSPLPKTGVPTLDRPSALLSFGARYSSGKSSLDFSITEDPNTAGAPDVSFTLALKRRF